MKYLLLAPQDLRVICCKVTKPAAYKRLKPVCGTYLPWRGKNKKSHKVARACWSAKQTPESFSLFCRGNIGPNWLILIQLWLRNSLEVVKSLRLLLPSCKHRIAGGSLANMLSAWPALGGGGGTCSNFKSLHMTNASLLFLFLRVKALLKNSAILRSPTIWNPLHAPQLQKAWNEDQTWTTPV